VAVGLLFIFGTASAGVGMSGYAIYKAQQLEISQAEIEMTLDIMDREVYVNSADLNFLQKEVKQMGVTMNNIIEDINLFKGKAIEVQFIVAYILS